MISTDELVQIATAGGGLDLRNVVISTDDLTRIAAAAAKTRASIKIKATRPLQAMIDIAAAGQGCVVIYFD